MVGLGEVGRGVGVERCRPGMRGEGPLGGKGSLVEMHGGREYVGGSGVKSIVRCGVRQVMWVSHEKM